MEFFSVKTNIDFLSKRRAVISVSVALLVVIFISFAVRGLNFGIDFTGGVLLEVGYSAPIELGEVRESLAAGGFGEASVQKFGSAQDVLVRLLPREGIESAELADQILAALREDHPEVQLRRVEFVGPQVGDELTERGGLALLFALGLILLYVVIRFQWKFAVGAIVATVHDVLITVGMFSLFAWPFDLSVLAAVLAVIGYSLNDTIVVFDRIRESFRRVRRGAVLDVMNVAINETLSRTIMTSLATLLVVLALLLLGGETLQGFSLALLVGILVGTYSSIYIASATALALDVAPADLIPPKRDTELDSVP